MKESPSSTSDSLFPYPCITTSASERVWKFPEETTFSQHMHSALITGSIESKEDSNIHLTQDIDVDKKLA